MSEHEIPDGPGDLPAPSLVLVILDGWGLADPGPGNAISLARTPTFDSLWSRYPHTTLSASGRDVGLPPGQMGNSEVGHLNLGAGKPVLQDLPRIDAAIADGSFNERPALLEATRSMVRQTRSMAVSRVRMPVIASAPCRRRKRSFSACSS